MIVSVLDEIIARTPRIIITKLLSCDVSFCELLVCCLLAQGSNLQRGYRVPYEFTGNNASPQLSGFHLHSSITTYTAGTQHAGL